MTDATLDTTAGGHPEGEATRRDFIFIATGAFAAVGAGYVTWMLVEQMLPAADTLAVSTTEVDLSQIPEGAEITAKWRNRPLFVRHRTRADIDAARAVNVGELRDPQTDEERLRPDADGALHPEYLIMVGVCTHFGCVPLGGKQGDFGGWFCPCHGSHYDSAGRIRKGPAPKNLEVPDYAWLSDTIVQVG